MPGRNGSDGSAELPEAAIELIRRFENRTAVVGVVGLGYVGLPLAAAFAKAGFRVIGYDISTAVVDSVSRGESHVADVSAELLNALVGEGMLSASADPDALGSVDAVSICVPTPLNKTRDPDVSHILAAADVLKQRLRRGQLVVLESTTYPGTTRELLVPRLGGNGVRIGEDLFLGFSPERVDPGNPTWKVENTPKVISGITPACLAVTQALYASVMKLVVPVSSTEAAELTKLLENTFRAVNIALVNEMAQVADRLGVDVWEVIDAAASKPFGFMKFVPGPGIGGHCIPLDPHYLSWKMKTLSYRTRLIELASEINAEMPRFVVEQIQTALNDRRKAVNGSRLLVLGVAYKRDVADTRESPALDLIRLLEELGAEVRYHDPHVPRVDEDGTARASVPLTEAELAAADCVVVATDHSAIDYRWVVEHSTLVVDSRNATRDCRDGRVAGPKIRNTLVAKG